MVDFQRALSSEQRAVRRAQILGTCTEMLDEMPVAELTLNELARRAGMSKSTVLRYFESREALLLTLLLDAAGEMLEQLPHRLSQRRHDGSSVADRIRSLGDVTARMFDARPVMCDLFSSQSSVLERNVSPETAGDYKRALMTANARLAKVVHEHLPELSLDACRDFARIAPLIVAGVWPVCQPAEAMSVAYAADPALAATRLEFDPTIARVFVTYLFGLLSAADSGPVSTLSPPV